MAEKLVGKWKCIENENMDEFLKKLGVGFMIRKVGASLKPTVTITFEKGEWIIKSETSVKNTVNTFKIDEEKDEELPDGKKVRSTTTLEGNKMIHTQRNNGTIVCIITREIDGTDQQIVILNADGVQARRVFKRID